VARAVNAGEVAASCGDNKAQIPEAVHRARVTAVSQWVYSAEGAQACAEAQHPG